jgi:hypothetical protein
MRKGDDELSGNDNESQIALCGGLAFFVSLLTVKSTTTLDAEKTNAHRY